LARRRTSRRVHRLGERELLSRGHGEEAPAAQLAARLAAAVDRDQLAPWRQPGLPRTEAPEQAVQQHARRELGAALDVDASSRAGLGAKSAAEARDIPVRDQPPAAAICAARTSRVRRRPARAQST